MKNKTIIQDSKLSLLLVFILLVAISELSAQQLTPAPTFRLMNSGYGAAALGMGGAFTAVANDLSAIYWNPSGIAQLPGLQIFGVYRAMGDSDEDFSSEVFPHQVEGPQSISVSGNQFQAVAVSYAFQTKKGSSFVPAFSWQRLGTTGPERKLKALSSVDTFTLDGNAFHSEGIFHDKIQDDEEEFSFAFAARPSKIVLVGGSMSFLRNGPKLTLDGTFHQDFTSPTLETSTDLNLSQDYHEEHGGHYFKVGALFYPQTPFSFGGYLRFPYTVKSDLFLQKTGPFTSTETVRDAGGNIISETTSNGSLNLNATAQSEIDVPFEWGAGLAIRPSNTFLVTGSVTSSNWQDVTRIVSNSSDPVVLPNETLPYPALRPTALQTSILQWRAGMEYLLGQFGRGLVIRSGIFRDSQPYAEPNGDRVYFHGYTAGAGMGLGSFRVDVAFVSEKGHLLLTPNSSEESNFKNRRWEISIGYISL